MSSPDITDFQPKHPTFSSFVRASTLSLGSIAFGSLIVTLLELVRMLLNAARNTAKAEGHRELSLRCFLTSRRPRH